MSKMDHWECYKCHISQLTFQKVTHFIFVNYFTTLSDYTASERTAIHVLPLVTYCCSVTPSTTRLRQQAALTCRKTCLFGVKYTHNGDCRIDNLVAAKILGDDRPNIPTTYFIDYY
jgi:hypothetical protein